MSSLGVARELLPWYLKTHLCGTRERETHRCTDEHNNKAVK